MTARSPLLGRVELLLAALIWGSSFFVMKSAVDVFPTFLLLCIRFAVGAGLLCLIFWRRLRALTRATWLRGGILGVLLCAAYAVQTFGLKETTPGKNAFLTAVYCVLVPFIAWGVTKKRPTVWQGLAGLLCLCGIGLVSLDGGLTMGRGDALTLVGGVIYAVHMVAVSRFSRGEDPVLLTMVQFASAALCAGLCSSFSETAPAAVPGGTWLELGYLCVFATTIALLLQTLGQAATPAAPASILLSLESVFGVLFSVVCYHEQVTWRLALGFAVIFAAVLLSVLKGEEAGEKTAKIAA